MGHRKSKSKLQACNLPLCSYYDLNEAGYVVAAAIEMRCCLNWFPRFLGNFIHSSLNFFHILIRKFISWHHTTVLFT